MDLEEFYGSLESNNQFCEQKTLISGDFFIDSNKNSKMTKEYTEMTKRTMNSQASILMVFLSLAKSLCINIIEK